METNTRAAIKIALFPWSPSVDTGSHYTTVGKLKVDAGFCSG